MCLSGVEGFTDEVRWARLAGVVRADDIFGCLFDGSLGDGSFLCQFDQNKVRGVVCTAVVILS